METVRRLQRQEYFAARRLVLQLMRGHIEIWDKDLAGIIILLVMLADLQQPPSMRVKRKKGRISTVLLITHRCSSLARRLLVQMRLATHF